MVTPQEVQDQLNRIGFKQHGWGKSEVKELPHILLPDEQIFECVNGFYDGGFALLLASDVRVLLIDKKPFNYLTVEDLRFDMINEIDYSHRLIGSNITIATGSKNMTFHSYNKARLRKLIGHVQDCMASSKKQQQFGQKDQNQHLEEINQRLQAYLIAQHQHQEELQQRLQTSMNSNTPVALPDVPKPDSALADYLYAQRLLAEHNAKNGLTTTTTIEASPVQVEEIHEEGIREVFGKHLPTLTNMHSGIEINPLKVAYSKLPMALRNRRFGRPSFHAHSQAEVLRQQTDTTPVQ